MTGPADRALADRTTRTGLTDDEALRRLRELGPNALPERRRHVLAMLLAKFWAPVPWMLETVLVLELLLGHATQAAIIGVLLLVNGVLSLVEESRARGAVDVLRARLAVRARVLRGGAWRAIPSEQLVPGDVIYLRLGDLVPADAKVLEGSLLADHSALTGESGPVEVEVGARTFSAALVRRGEAVAEVVATGARSEFGRTAELVQLAHARGRFEELVLRIVRALVAVDVVIVLVVVAYALWVKLPMHDVAPFGLMMLVASVPVALPATFTLATALGSVELAREGVLVTRLSAIEDAASMDVLCSDKTGTLTTNELAVATVRPLGSRDEPELLRLAALASTEAAQDPLDAAILRAAAARGAKGDASERLRFVPFEPALKRSEAFVRERDGSVLRVVKGAPRTIATLTASPPSAASARAIDELAARGERAIAVAAGPEDALELIGLIGLQDPPREDSRAIVGELHELGVQVVMATGDAAETARDVARRVSIGDSVSALDAVLGRSDCPLLHGHVFAGVYPEDKLRLVEALQRAGHVVGMTGDGVNDSPALKQAEVGFAMANATDVAKRAASVVLTNPGLSGVLPAIAVSRRIYQRMLTYTLNKIVKTFHVSLVLAAGLFATGTLVTTPRLILLLLLANDLVTMSIASDRARSSPTPDEWHVRPLIATAFALACGWLAFTSTVFVLGREAWGLSRAQLETLVFVALVFASQATVFLVRERGHLASTRPGPWLVGGAFAAVLGTATLATAGILMEPIPPGLVASVLGLALLALGLLDLVKTRLFDRLGLAMRRAHRTAHACAGGSSVASRPRTHVPVHQTFD